MQKLAIKLKKTPLANPRSRVSRARLIAGWLSLETRDHVKIIKRALALLWSSLSIGKRDRLDGSPILELFALKPFKNLLPQVALDWRIKTEPGV